ncbi:hypothetical protein ABIC37_005063 [Priestia megaterium]|uniref:hypothetical protein n=1 Tax=Priestia megaterium TaxID=1404 RepID=UPI003399FD7A
MEVIYLCKRILKNNNLSNVSLELTEEYNYCMYYELNTRKIFINPSILLEDSSQYDLPFEAYVTIIFCHELGHYLDEELQDIDDLRNLCKLLLNDPNRSDEKGLIKNIRDCSMKAEINAWDIAERFINPVIIKDFKIIKEKSLCLAKETVDLEMQRALIERRLNRR